MKNKRSPFKKNQSTLLGPCTPAQAAAAKAGKSKRASNPILCFLSHKQVCKALRINRIDLRLLIAKGKIKSSAGNHGRQPRISKHDLFIYAAESGKQLNAVAEYVLMFIAIHTPFPNDLDRKIFVLAAGTEPADGDVARWDEENGDGVSGTITIAGDSGTFVMVADEGNIKSIAQSKI